ncbi:MAG: hypothetical protein O7A98_02635, partial [Acidobacteria bacterium]|nr:hypothetical protein [Acidobacteriota bacterium]
MPNSKLLLGAVVAVALVVSFACSDSDSNASADEQPVSQTSETPDDTGGAGSGSATLTIGSKSWTVTGIYCAFSPEDAGNERVSFTMSGYTETAEGVRVQLHATIMDPEE